MVSIGGLPVQSIPNRNKVDKAKNKQQVQKSQDKAAVGQPSKVANAVSHSIRHLNESDLNRAHIQYDLPQGRGRKAMEEYMDVMNQARKEELSNLLGVDIYI
ncbi:chromosome partitioning protein ParA [Vibrio sp. WXL103]|uniref:chromosome partitioning protein ParA n=1 Tax=unclassified Vibrio TaxID=2614977 RepID=UPI003EC8FAAA